MVSRGLTGDRHEEIVSNSGCGRSALFGRGGLQEQRVERGVGMTSVSVPPAAALPSASSGTVTASAVASTPAISASATTSASARVAPAAGKADKAHPCSLVTFAEVQAALGVPATITTSNVDDGIYTNCVFKSADGNHILQISTFDDRTASPTSIRIPTK
jgi:hypothetical protein